MQALHRGASARKALLLVQLGKAELEKDTARRIQEAKKRELESTAMRVAAEEAAAKFAKTEAERKAQRRAEDARAKAEAEMRAAHDEKCAAITAAKELKRAAEDALEAHRQKLLEDELETKLALELNKLNEWGMAAKGALAATEAAEVDVADILALERSKKQGIDILNEQLISYQQVSKLVATYSKQCADCKEIVTSSEEKEVRMKTNNEIVMSRVAVELKESEQRHAKQTAYMNKAQSQLDSLNAEFDDAEQRAMDAILVTSSEAASQTLKLEVRLL
jgi:hypothetical protein